jgi:hypothetical protein
VTQTTLGATICIRGYTATVRPPVSVTEPIKRAEMVAYGLQGQPLSAIESTISSRSSWVAQPRTWPVADKTLAGHGLQPAP